jgi:hypothetical protein
VVGFFCQEALEKYMLVRIDAKPGKTPWPGQGWRRPGLAFLMLTAVALAVFAAQPAQAHDVATPAAVGATTALDGLLVDETLCGSGYRIPGADLCTHGPDDPPAGAAEEPDQPRTPAPVVCVGNGVDGKRVQVMYVRMANTADRYAAWVDAIRGWAAGVDEIFDRSARVTGGRRHIRFVTNANCQIDVLNVVLPAGTGETFTGMIGALRARGYDSPDRKYLLFVDADVYCGIGTAIGDSSPGPENRNNERTGYARVDNPCWGSDTAAHELTHTLGGVQHSAPNASGGWHCTDEYDLMCYSDPPHYPAMAYPCPLAHGLSLDCNNDDYYHTDPPPDSYLANHWNVANSAFLTTEQPPNVPPVIDLATPGDVRALVAPAAIPLTATAVDPDGAMARVEFYSGESLLASDDAFPYTMTWNIAASGVYTVAARAYDNEGASTTSAPLSVTVTEPVHAPPVVHLSMMTAATLLTTPVTITLWAEVTTTHAAVVQVDFYAGEIWLGSDLTAPYTLAWRVESSGTYTLTAQARDTRGASAVSPPLALVMAPPKNPPVDNRQDDGGLPATFYLPVVARPASDE